MVGGAGVPSSPRQVILVTSRCLCVVANTQIVKRKGSQLAMRKNNSPRCSLRKLMLFFLVFSAQMVNAQVDVSISSGNGLDLKSGDIVNVSWSVNASGAQFSDVVVISLKRDDIGTQNCPDPEECPGDWVRLSVNTLNDESERIVLPSGLTEANDWKVFVGHAPSGTFGGSVEYTYSDEASARFALNIFVDTENGGAISDENGSCSNVDECEVMYNPGDVVRLQATPGEGFGFSFYDGCDEGPLVDEWCTITMTNNKNIDIHFGSDSECSGEGFFEDCDGDALPDQWEVTGLGEGGDFIDLQCFGSAPKKKDLFLWIDHMEELLFTGGSGVRSGSAVVRIYAGPDSIALEKVKSAFWRRGVIPSHRVAEF